MLFLHVTTGTAIAHLSRHNYVCPSGRWIRCLFQITI